MSIRNQVEAVPMSVKRYSHRQRSVVCQSSTASLRWWWCGAASVPSGCETEDAGAASSTSTNIVSPSTPSSLRRVSL
jgi:hypothetical protein